MKPFWIWVFLIPKFSYTNVRKAFPSFLNEISKSFNSFGVKLNVQVDRIHVVMSIPQKYDVSAVMGFLKGKLSLRLFQRYERLGERYWGRQLWIRGYCVSMVGPNEQQIREYVKWQEKREKEIEKKEYVQIDP